MQAKRGRPIPEWFLDEPPLPESGRWFLHAFDRLSTCRPTGFDLGPIPWTAIRAYAESRGLDGDMTEVFEAVIMTLDRVWLEDMERHRPKRAQHSGSGNAGL